LATGRVERFLFLCLLWALSIRAVSAEGTRIWEQSKFEDFSKGTPHGVALSSQGGLALAPLFKLLATTPSTYIWAVVADRGGNLYAATGAPARIYRISPEGAIEAIFEPHELQVQSLVIDPQGVLYAATNPDGKVYRITNRAPAAPRPAPAGSDAAKVASDSPWSSAVYFDPGTKYIWNMVLDRDGNLFVATGDQGQIFRVTPQGEHSLFFKSDEAHIRALAFDAEHNLIAGSDGSGLIYRIRGNGEGFVLYSAPKKEITALATDEAGNIYAAGVGEKRAGNPGSALPFPPFPSPGPTLGPAQQAGGANPAGPAGTFSFGSITANPASAATGGSDIYRIAPDGSPSRMWSSAENLVYALAFDRSGHLLAGTGNHGHVFSIDGGDEYTDLFKANASQVTAFAPTPGGGLYAATSNLGKAFVLGATSEAEGSFESDVFDAHIFSRWGRVEVRSKGKVELWARSGNVDNPDRNWSPWRRIELDRDALVGAPPARFVEWKAVLRAGDPAPSLESVTLYYLPKNVAPEVEEITIQPGSRYPSSAKIMGGEMGGVQHLDAPPPAAHDRDSIGVRWSAHDENDDQMVYAIYYRGDREQRWLLLKDNIVDKFYSFDASLLPDGGYTLKVVASDAPSHPPGEALTGEKQSARFEVDTTPPALIELHATLEGGATGRPAALHVQFRAVDGFSAIERAEYSVDASDWRLVEPVGQLSDANSENYDFRVALAALDPAATLTAPGALTPAPALARGPALALGAIEHVVVVRAWDRYGNMGSAKAVVEGSPLP
jgi:WD40 repeat protein